MTNFSSLLMLGWQSFFQQQLTLDDIDRYVIARVMRPHRSEVIVSTIDGDLSVPITNSMPQITVGDWILLDNNGVYVRLLDRLSLFSRKAAGIQFTEQYIAANVDTAFIVCSLNQDFNLNRIERYLALSHEAGVVPVVVLTKADCCEDVEKYVAQVQQLDPMLMTIAVNALNADSVNELKSWCSTGRTIVFLGSSGVGKSTLINTLLDNKIQKTGSIRDDDGKGRHNTTGRSLHLMPSGAILLDTPGMRELQLIDCEQGIESTYSDIVALSKQCRFTDCKHLSEPGCCVLAAINDGDLDERRLLNYQKLLQERDQGRISKAEKREKDRSLTRYYRSTQRQMKKIKNVSFE